MWGIIGERVSDTCAEGIRQQWEMLAAEDLRRAEEETAGLAAEQAEEQQDLALSCMHARWRSA